MLLSLDYEITLALIWLNNLKIKNKYMNFSLILFLIGILGFVLNRKNIILMLISIEIMLLSITFLILVSSLTLDDIIGQTYAIIYTYNLLEQNQLLV